MKKTFLSLFLLGISTISYADNHRRGLAEVCREYPFSLIQDCLQMAKSIEVAEVCKEYPYVHIVKCLATAVVKMVEVKAVYDQPAVSQLPQLSPDEEALTAAQKHPSLSYAVGMLAQYHASRSKRGEKCVSEIMAKGQAGMLSCDFFLGRADLKRIHQMAQNCRKKLPWYTGLLRRMCAA